MTTTSRTFACLFLLGLSATASAGQSDAQQRLSVKGSVVNQARFGSASTMEIASSHGQAVQQSVHIKGSVINQSAGKKNRATVSVGSK